MDPEIAALILLAGSLLALVLAPWLARIEAVRDLLAPGAEAELAEDGRPPGWWAWWRGDDEDDPRCRS